MKKNKWAMGFTACLTAFTVFLAMDTFVLSSAYQTDATQMNTAMIREAESVKTALAGTEDTGAEDTGAEDTGAEDTGAEVQDAASSATKDGDQRKTGQDTEDSSGEGKEESAENGTGGKDDAGNEKPDADGSKKKAPGAGGAGGHHKKPGSRSGESAVRSSGESPSVQKGESSVSSGSQSGDSYAADGGKAYSGSRPGKTSSFNEEEAAQEAAAVTTDNAGNTSTYEDDGVKISYTTYTTNGTTVHVADVQLSSIESLKTAFAEDTYGKNVTQSTSEMAEAHNAVLAVNGDYYGVQERGYVIRNGVVYRDQAGTADVLCIYGDGSMKVVDPSTATAQELVDQGVWQAFSFGPGLIENGEISVELSTEVGKAKASNPRTAIGVIDDLHYVFVVSDGRSGESEGLSLYELASFMQQLGVRTAYNLDGGGSSTMYFQGEVVNDPAGGFGGFGNSEREVSDIVYIG